MWAGLLLWSGPVPAVLQVEPVAPTEDQPIRISLTRQYNSESAVLEASIAREGNQIRISQTVVYSCFLPSAPTLTSSFDIGPLPRGTYQVTSTTLIVPGLPGCVPPPTIMESTAIVVGQPVQVPGPGAGALLALALGLVFLARGPAGRSDPKVASPPGWRVHGRAPHGRTQAARNDAGSASGDAGA